jgi:general secretion pathway protein G
MRRISMKRIKRGFTLIELLVVILILAILATLIVPKVLERIKDAKRAKAASDVEMLSNLLTHYHLDNDVFPTTEEGLQALRVAPSGAKNWRGPYSEKDIPVDPWSNEYVYESPGPNSEDSYVITSYGEDGAEGGEGNASDIVRASE